MTNKVNMKNVLFFDTETTGIPQKDAKWDVDFMAFPHIVSIAWILNDKEKQFIIKPDGWTIPEAATAIHGITTEQAVKEGVPFDKVIMEFIEDCNAAHLLVGYNMYFDTSIIKANVLREIGQEYYNAECEDALYKGKRVDPMKKVIKFVGVKFENSNRLKYPKLTELYYKLFEEEFDAHQALSDVKALKRCIPELVGLGYIELKQKTYSNEKANAMSKKKESPAKKQEAKKPQYKKRGPIVRVSSKTNDIVFDDKPVELPQTPEKEDIY